MVGMWAVLLGQASEPQAFRAVFEDRPKQLIVRVAGAPQDGLHYVFSPDTCSIRKIWKGGIQYRGKVYDFSQENSYATGKAVREVESSILTSSDFNGYDAKPWTFKATGEAIKSKPFSMFGWGPIYLSFEERGDTGSFDIRVNQNAATAIYYSSSNTILGPNVWQWNYKQIPHDPEVKGNWVMQFQTGKITAPKSLQKIRLFGDRLAWYDGAGKPLSARYIGYKTMKGKTTIDCQVGSSKVSISAVPTQSGCEVTYELSGNALGLQQWMTDERKVLDPGMHSYPKENIWFSKSGTYRFEVKL